MKKNTTPLVIVMVIALAIATGVGLALMPKKGEAPVPDAATQAETANVEQQFEDLLNELLNTVRERMQAYGQQRKILTELVNPQNLKDPAYIEENYKIMQDLAMDLHTRTAELLHSFEMADAKVKAVLDADPALDTAAIRTKWNAEKQKHYATYNEFFSYEEKIIQGYQDLMTFYKIKQGSFTVDVAANKVTFTNADDQLRVGELQAQIETLSAKQAAALQASND
jgi:hypothetical protein